MKSARWFQIHLSTAILLMICASGLLFANMAPRHSILVDTNTGSVVHYVEVNQGTPEFNEWFGAAHFNIRRFGWPWRSAYTSDCANGYYSESELFIRDDVSLHWQIGYTFMNALVALGILASITAALEWRIRRRDIALAIRLAPEAS